MPRGRSGVVNQELFEAALEGLEAQRKRLDDQIRQVRSMIGGAPAGRRGPAKKATGTAAAQPAQETGAPARRRRPRLSAEARKRIAAAQKKRWAEYRKGSGAAAKSTAKSAKPEQKK